MGQMQPNVRLSMASDNKKIALIIMDDSRITIKKNQRNKNYTQKGPEEMDTT